MYCPTLRSYVLCSGGPATGATTSVVGLVLSTDGVRLIKGVPPFAMRFRSVLSELSLRIPKVVLALRNGFQVIRSNTSGRPTEMVDHEAFGDRPVRQLVREPMGQHRTLFSTSSPKKPVASRQAVCRPKPALSRPIDLRPEPLLSGSGYEFRAGGSERVAMTLPAAVVHSAPPSFLSGLLAGINGTKHMSSVPQPCRGWA